MSNPGLTLYAQAKIEVSFLEDYFGVRFIAQEPQFHAVEMFATWGGSQWGGLDLQFSLPPWYVQIAEFLTQEDHASNEEVKQEWASELTIRNHYAWNPVRDVMVLQLWEALSRLYAGDYRCEFTTGGAFFASKGRTLILTEEEREYFSRFPLPTGIYKSRFGNI